MLQTKNNPELFNLVNEQMQIRIQFAPNFTALTAAVILSKHVLQPHLSTIHFSIKLTRI